MGFRIGLISNPYSGGNRKGLQPVEKRLAGYGRTIHQQVVEPQQVAAAIRDFASRGWISWPPTGATGRFLPC